MPQTYPAFTYIPPTHITPITCPKCATQAHLIRREYHAELKGERRIFQCSDCGSETEMTVKD
jgi:hypothetical protein